VVELAKYICLFDGKSINNLVTVYVFVQEVTLYVLGLGAV